MQSQDVPVNPFRTSLYSADELLGAFDPSESGSYTETIDFKAYRSYVTNGRSMDVPYMHSMVRALHDNSITQAVNRFVDGRKVVGIMGGHNISRTSESYGRVAALAGMLSADDYTVASGGGPGAMEAIFYSRFCDDHQTTGHGTRIGTRETAGIPKKFESSESA